MVCVEICRGNALPSRHRRGRKVAEQKPTICWDLLEMVGKEVIIKRKQLALIAELNQVISNVGDPRYLPYFTVSGIGCYLVEEASGGRLGWLAADDPPLYFPNFIHIWDQNMHESVLDCLIETDTIDLCKPEFK